MRSAPSTTGRRDAVPPVTIQTAVCPPASDTARLGTRTIGWRSTGGGPASAPVRSGVLGAGAFMLFHYLYASSHYTYWWGSWQHGAAGLLFAVIVGGMVFCALWGLVILVFGAAMLARIFSLPMELRPFHRDKKRAQQRLH